MAPKDKPDKGVKEKKADPKAPAVKDAPEVKDAPKGDDKTEPKTEEPEKKPEKVEPKKKRQKRLFVKDEAPAARITAQAYCASMKPDQRAGFLAECKRVHGVTELATVETWKERHEAFKKRPIK
ncbi:MAG: hypothetical protein ACYTFZ_08685 [Planctomycetota bacterium]|jgi:hypothetical protein